jgi:uncharacterized protein YndB with AHSA1/START domain
MTTFPAARHISVSINVPPGVVYDFVADPRNLPRWAAGLSGSIEAVDGEWLAESPLGRVKVQFAEGNAFGVLDHDVTLESGVTVHNPMRVLANNDGSEVVFTLFRRPEMDGDAFEADAHAVARDLQALRRLLEG